MRTRQRLETRQVRSLAMTQGLRQAIGLLNLSNQELRRYLEAEAASNPYLELAPPPPSEPVKGGDRAEVPPTLARIWPAVPAAEAGGSAGANTGFGDADALAGLSGQAPGLLEHVLAGIDLTFRDPRRHAVAVALAGALEPSGWLGQPLSGIAADCGCSLETAEEVLAEVQRQADPAGLFARSLAECLRLQAEDRGLLDPVMNTVLGNLGLLADGRIEELAQMAGATVEKVHGALRHIRSFDPKPGARFVAEAPMAAPPDLIVRRKDGEWEVELNGSTLPTVRLRDTGSAATEAEAAARQAAAAVLRSVERRNQTMLKVGLGLVRHQVAFLDGGPAQLRPLSQAALGKLVGVHESTISRVCAGAMISTPRGALPLRAFFGAAIGSDRKGEGVAAAAIRHDLAQMIAAEDPASPLSDAAIAVRFAARGVRLARRTVAKYREEMGIGSSTQRRRR